MNKLGYYAVKRLNILIEDLEMKSDPYYPEVYCPYGHCADMVIDLIKENEVDHEIQDL